MSANNNREAPITPRYPLRRCALCQQWNSRPCGEGCGFDLRDPTWEEYLAREAPRPPSEPPEKTENEGNVT